MYNSVSMYRTDVIIAGYDIDIVTILYSGIESTISHQIIYRVTTCRSENEIWS